MKLTTSAHRSDVLTLNWVDIERLGMGCDLVYPGLVVEYEGHPYRIWKRCPKPSSPDPRDHMEGCSHSNVNLVALDPRQLPLLPDATNPAGNTISPESPPARSATTGKS
jgi:hypothetical protein